MDAAGRMLWIATSSGSVVSVEVMRLVWKILSEKSSWVGHWKVDSVQQGAG